MTPENLKQHRRGIALTALGGVALSFDIPLVRLGHGDVWSVIALRSLSTFVVGLLAWGLIRRFTNSRPVLVPGRAGLMAGLFYGLATVCFLASIYHTSAANAVFLIAFNPMFCALLAWIFLKERPPASTLVTMLAMVGGVALIVGDGLAAGHYLGDGLAILCAFFLAAAITTGRASGKAMQFAPLVATVFPAIIGFAIAVPQGFHIENPVWILIDGAITIPLAFWCLATGPRYLQAAEVGMFYLLETILAPIWIWMIFREAPTTSTLAGGLILIVALAGNSLWQMRAKALAASRL